MIDYQKRQSKIVFDTCSFVSMKDGFKNLSFEILMADLFLYLVQVENEGVTYKGVVSLHLWSA